MSLCHRKDFLPKLELYPLVISCTACGFPRQAELPSWTFHKIFQTNSSALIRDVWLTSSFVTRLIIDGVTACYCSGIPLGPLLYYRIPKTRHGQNLLIPVGQLTLQVMTTTQLVIPSDLLYRPISASQSPGDGLCLSCDCIRQIKFTSQHTPSSQTYFCSLNSNSLPCRNQRSILTV